MAADVSSPADARNVPAEDDLLAGGPDFGDAVLGRAIPPEVEALVREAGRLRHLPGQAEALLLKARALAPAHPVPLIALYRFHFYGHRLKESMAVSREALQVGLAALGPEFLEAPPDPERARFDPVVRFYLFSLKGYAYLNLRLGDLEGGAQALAELRRLDPEDHVGGAVLAQVLARVGREDEDDEADPTPRSASQPLARGWKTGGAA